MATTQQQTEMLPGLTARQFRKIAPNGFGDPYNSYAHAMTWYRDHLYVGTTRANLAQRGLQISKKTPEKLGSIWPVKIPADNFDFDLRAEIWRYHPPTDQWTRVFLAPTGIGKDGFEVPLSVGFRSMLVFKAPGDTEPVLYVPTWPSHQTPGAVMMRSEDGLTFEPCSERGLGIKDNPPRSLRGLLAFKNMMFTSPVIAGSGRLEPNIAGTAIIYVSTHPRGGEWKLAADINFGDPNNLSVFQMCVFNGFLYAGTLNVQEGFQIWKTDAEGKPPFRWKKVMSHGAYRGVLNQIAMTLVPFQGCLYVGTGVQNCGFDYDNNIGPATPEVLRLYPDDSWDLLFGDPRQTPDGFKIPLSGRGPGLGKTFVGYIWSICVHEGWLYMGTAVWTVFLRYSGRENQWPDYVRGLFSSASIERVIHRSGGCDLWRTRDGHRWVPVTNNGFDNCFNIGFRTMVSTPHGLFAGTANPFGPEVAFKRTADWRYEHNPQGGCELWVGTRNPPPAPAQPPESAHPQKAARPPGSFGSNRPVDPEPESLERLLDGLFDNSGYRHLGFWATGIRDARAACDNLMGEILAFLPDRAGRILDIGCGHGASTEYLLKQFPAESILGLSADPLRCEACAKRLPQVQFLHCPLPNLDLEPESFEQVFLAKSSEPLGGRKKLLRQIFRVLKPGGRFAAFDVVFNGAASSGRKRGHTAFRTAAEYKNYLLRLGFQDVQTLDVTESCLQGLRNHLARHFGFKRAAGEADERTGRDAEDALLGEDGSIGACLLVSAFKPDPNAAPATPDANSANNGSAGKTEGRHGGRPSSPDNRPLSETPGGPGSVPAVSETGRPAASENENNKPDTRKNA